MLKRIAAALILFVIATPALAQQAWAPSESQREAARAAAESYWGAVDRGDSAGAYGQLAPNLVATQSQSQFTTIAHDFALISGAITERNVTHINWSQNPAGAEPGVYVAIDITARFENIDRYCGFIILRQAPAGGAFQVTRIEENFLDNPTAARLGAQADPTWARMVQDNCPNAH